MSKMTWDELDEFRRRYDEAVEQKARNFPALHDEFCGAVVKALFNSSRLWTLERRLRRMVARLGGVGSSDADLVVWQWLRQDGARLDELARLYGEATGLTGHKRLALLVKMQKAWPHLAAA